MQDIIMPLKTLKKRPNIYVKSKFMDVHVDSLFLYSDRVNKSLIRYFLLKSLVQMCRSTS